MSILISDAERDSFVSSIQNHFDTFSRYHELVVVKEPIKQILNITNESYNNYGYQSAPENYTLIPQSGIFNVMTYDSDSWKDQEFDPIPVSLSRGDVVFKITETGKNYISNGKTELVILDGEAYNIVGGPLPKNYLNQWYFYYSLERTT